jgi:hypothetical protein
MAKFIYLTEKGKTVFRFVELMDRPVNKVLDEIMSMETLRGFDKTNKSDAMRRAILYYHNALKKGTTDEHNEAV